MSSLPGFACRGGIRPRVPGPPVVADPLAQARADLAAERAAHDVLRGIAAVQGREIDALRARVAELEEALTAPPAGPPGKRTR